MALGWGTPAEYRDDEFDLVDDDGFELDDLDDFFDLDGGVRDRGCHRGVRVREHPECPHSDERRASDTEG